MIYTMNDHDGNAPIIANTGLAGTLIPAITEFLVTRMGWTLAFSDTNKAAYKQPVGSNGFYLLVDDSTASYTSFRGYETMSSISTGFNPFPSPTQASNGITVSRSNTSYNGTSVRYRMISDGSMVHFYFAGYNASQARIWQFVDIIKLRRLQIYRAR